MSFTSIVFQTCSQRKWMTIFRRTEWLVKILELSLSPRCLTPLYLIDLRIETGVYSLSDARKISQAGLRSASLGARTWVRKSSLNLLTRNCILKLVPCTSQFSRIMDSSCRYVTTMLLVNTNFHGWNLPAEESKWSMIPGRAAISHMRHLRS